MKIAIVSDIHSNLQALRAVLDDIQKIDAGLILCAGDVVGYGGDPNECCNLISKAAHLAVFGNHEVAALTGDTVWMNSNAAKAAKWTGSVLDQRSRDYLDKLELSARTEISGRMIAMYHGSIDSAIEYVYEESLSPDLLMAAETDVLILGHTHIPYVVRFEQGLAVNPGSVGQPRDMNPKASYAVLDPARMICEIRRVDYDIESAQKSIANAGLPVFLAERLLIGR